MQRFSFSLLGRLSQYIFRKKLLREALAEFFNHGIGYLAGVLAYSNLSLFFEVKGIRNLWGITNFRHKTLVSRDTFELMEFVISGLAGFLIFKLATYYSSRIWGWYEKRHSLKEETRNQA